MDLGVSRKHEAGSTRPVIRCAAVLLAHRVKLGRGWTGRVRELDAIPKGSGAGRLHLLAPKREAAGSIPRRRLHLFQSARSSRGYRL